MSTPARCDTDPPPAATAGRPARLRAVAAPPTTAPPTTAPPTTAVPTTAVQFSESVRTVVELARNGGLTAPVFRSPPRLDDVDRTIRRGRHAAVVSIRRLGRPLAAVQADVIEGVVAANGLTGARADRFRRVAWQRLEPRAVTLPPGPRRSGPPPRRVPEGRVA